MLLQDVNIWTVIAWMVAAAWVVIFAIFYRALSTVALLRPTSDPVEESDIESLSIVVAARNESRGIETCIRSLLRQDYRNLEVVAINDRSTDDTGKILDRLEVEFGDRLKVVHVTNLPSGWFGKPNALTQGLSVATGTYVCFTDADCVFQAPSAVRTGVAELIRRKLDFMSIGARYTMTSIRECVAVPCCSEALLMWLRPERVEDPEWPDAFANGAFILVKRESFDQIGGWSSVRTQISEDLQLARHAKRSGYRVGVVSGEGFYTTEAYSTMRDSWNGWSRIFKGALTPAQLLITVCRMLILFGLPFGATMWGLSQFIGTGSLDWFTHGTGLGFLVAFSLRSVMDLLVFHMTGAPVYASVLAPLGRMYVMAISVKAIFSHAGWVHTHWRGATFSAGQLVMPQRAKPGHQIP